MTEKKFDPKKLEKLNNPNRLVEIPPDYIWSKLNLRNPEMLVDIGAGTGFFSIEFINQMENGKIFACDISDIMIEWMRENICDKYPNIIPIKMEENNVPVGSNLADLVYMINLHHELDNPNKILKESFRVLKENGKIFIVDWKKEDTQYGPPKHLRYHAEDVKEELKKIGFKNISIFNEMPKNFLIVAEK